MSSHAGPARRAGRFTVLYVACWACLALAAVSYLGMLALDPQVASNLVKIKRTGPPDAVPTEAQRNVSRALAELQDVRQSLSQVRDDVDGVKEVLAAQKHVDRSLDELRSEVGEVRASIASGDDRNRELAARVAAIEKHQAMAEDESRQPAERTAEARHSAPQTTSHTVTGSVRERPRHAAADDRAAAMRERPRQEPAPERRASATAMPSFKTVKVITSPKPKPPAQRLGLHLSTAVSLDELRLSWLRISSSNKATLQAFEPVYTEMKHGGAMRYRLMVGPYADETQAARACGALKANRFRCTVAPYSGQPL